MHAIITKYHGPTNHKPSRISATWQSRKGPIRATVSYDHAKDFAGNHRAACAALMEKLVKADTFYSHYDQKDFTSAPLNQDKHVHIWAPAGDRE